ncbi:MAG: anthranilate phosphoribosyltransferase [Terrimicrobiaceae bacterium]
MTFHDIVSTLSTGVPLTAEEIRVTCDGLLDASLPVGTRAEALSLLHRRGETPEEIAGFVRVLLEHARPVSFSGDGCIDVCGTGGDKAGLFNVSTAVMFVAAACGARVVKHGNRGITSKSGGADVLEALGVLVDLPPERAAAALDSAGCCFLFAPHYHPAFQAVAPVRKCLAERGETSIFNMLGPLLNPASPSYQLAGVFDERLLPVYAEVFALLGRRRAWAVHGTGPVPLDEISPLAPSKVAIWEDGAEREFLIHPNDLGIGPIQATDLAGGSAAFNAGIISDVLAGNLRNGARTIVQMNAGAALVVSGLATDLQAGWHLAGEAIDSGAARDVLDRLRAAR